MKKAFYVSGLVAMTVFIASVAVYADSIVRVKCEDEDVGAEVYINGKFVGNCPVDVPAKEGTVHLRARKIVNGDYEKLFEKQLRVVDGVPQRVEVIMSAPQLTTDARRRNEAAEAGTQLRAAEAGNIEAMKKMAEYYDAGIGVGRDPSKAKIWREKAEKAEVAAAQALLRAAKAGDIEAMKKIAACYEAGRGVKKDTSQARAWREKAATLEHEKQAQAKARIKEERLNRLFFSETRQLFRDMQKDPTVSIFSPMSLLFDVLSLPSQTTEYSKIKNEAALRPSRWGKPDSMIAKASRQLEASSSANDNSLIVATK